MATHDQSSLESASFDLPLVAPNRRMTEEEFVAWCDQDARAEWVDGEVIMMTPVNTDHADLFGWLIAVTRVYVERHRLGRVMGSEFQIRLAGQKSRRVPDILFVAQARVGMFRKAHLEGPPDLVMEIVSPESEVRDKEVKFSEYQAAGVSEYWLIDPESHRAEVYSLSDRREYEPMAERDGWLFSSAIPGFRVKSEWLWTETRPTILDALKELGLI